MSASLELHGVARTYEGHSPVHALLATDLSLDPGSFVAITGASGSGKSTLLNILGLLDTPSRGRYLVAGIDTTNLREAERTALRAGFFGFVFQASYLIGTRTVTENVELGLVHRGVPARRRHSIAVGVLTDVGLAHRLDARPNTLSGGEKQRVALARALAVSPSVLLCDEPTGNLDSANTSVVLDLLQNLNAEGLTVIIVTHDPLVATRTAQQLVVTDGLVQQ